MPVATTVPEKLPTGITKFKNGFRTRMCYGSGNTNEISKCFTNTKNTDVTNYNLALNWLEMLKIQKQSGIPRETLNTEIENERSVKKLPELISRDRNGYLATYYNEQGYRHQKSFQGGKLGGFNDENLQNAIAFRDSMMCNHPKNKKKEQNGKGNDIDESKITLDNINNYTIPNFKQILKKREIHCPSKWIKKDYIEQVTEVLKLGSKDEVNEEEDVEKEIIIEDEEDLGDEIEDEEDLGDEIEDEEDETNGCKEDIEIIIESEEELEEDSKDIEIIIETETDDEELEDIESEVNKTINFDKLNIFGDKIFNLSKSTN